MLQIKCPVCNKLIPWKRNPYRPFCSERCRLIDLGAWASEEYRIPGENMRDEKKPESEKKD
ncbi:MAG: DNA gyrase inhibitor YacG [Deltaproteobacteria bacterium]|nr:MAG: DNA gyrase inhibitor YacG [Deltaproteobacteria bacterium]